MRNGSAEKITWGGQAGEKYLRQPLSILFCKGFYTAVNLPCFVKFNYLRSKLFRKFPTGAASYGSS
jgi:hypothetical protein